MSAQQIGGAASIYLVGAVGGALFFGWLTDRLGRKRLFTITLLVYVIATICTAFAWDFWSFALFRLITGAGIGGEYAAVNATIQELIPARRRGFTDLAINGSFWLGAALGAIGALVALDPDVVPPELGWRDGVSGRRRDRLRRAAAAPLPAGKPALADDARAARRKPPTWSSEIERRVEAETGPLPPVPPTRLRVRVDTTSWFGVGLRVLVTEYQRRTVVGVVLMAAQAFCYNAVFFTYALILTKFYGIASGSVGWFMLPFAAGNFLGPLVLGQFFDTIGRKTMISGTYALSGVMLIVTGWLFAAGLLDAAQQTAAWTAIFFVASAAASSAYLTVGESFPLEVRAVAIAIFYAFGTGLGGVAGPADLRHADRARRARGHSLRLRAGRRADDRGGDCPGGAGHRERAPPAGGYRPAALCRAGAGGAPVPPLIRAADRPYRDFPASGTPPAAPFRSAWRMKHPGGCRSCSSRMAAGHAFSWIRLRAGRGIYGTGWPRICAASRRRSGCVRGRSW